MKSTMSLARVFALAVLAAGLAPLSARADTTLRYSNWLPANYFFNKHVLMPYFEDIAKATEGRVKVEATPKVVGSVSGQYDVIADGLADVGFILPGYTPGRFLLAEGFELPFLGDEPVSRCSAVWQAYEQFIAATPTFEDVEIMGILCTNAGQIATAKTELKSIDDIKGLKLRTPSPPIAKALELMGAVPINKPASEIYELASGGIIDGAIIPLDSMVDFKLDGPLKQVNVVPGGMVSTIILITFNKASWAEIGEDDRKAILALSGEALGARAGQALQTALAEARGKLEASGVRITEPSAEVVEQIRTLVNPVREDWIAAAKNAGMANPEAMLDFIASIAVKTN